MIDKVWGPKAYSTFPREQQDELKSMRPCAESIRIFGEKDRISICNL